MEKQKWSHLMGNLVIFARRQGFKIRNYGRNGEHESVLEMLVRELYAGLALRKLHPAEELLACVGGAKEG